MALRIFAGLLIALLGRAGRKEGLGFTGIVCCKLMAKGNVDGFRKGGVRAEGSAGIGFWLFLFSLALVFFALCVPWAQLAASGESWAAPLCLVRYHFATMSRGGLTGLALMEIKFGACHLAGLDVQRWSLCVVCLLSRLLLNFWQLGGTLEGATTNTAGGDWPRMGTEGRAGRVGHGGLFTSWERAWWRSGVSRGPPCTQTLRRPSLRNWIIKRRAVCVWCLYKFSTYYCFVWIYRITLY